MAGFLSKVGNSYRNNNVSGFLRDLSRLGMKYDTMVIKNSQAVGYIESEMSKTSGSAYFSDDEYSLFYGMGFNDMRFKRNTTFYHKNYEKKREEFINISMQDEIEYILDIVSDESIVYDEKNYFCKPSPIELDFKKSQKKEIDEALKVAFKKIYLYFGFNDDTSAWSYYKKWLVLGFLAFEIIYDDKKENIIGFKELDPITLTPGLDAKGRKVWYQYKDKGAQERTLYDTQIIYINYSSLNSPSRVSYLERLIRPFNILRIMEHTRVIWAVVNASFKTKFVIPIGAKSKTRAKQSLRKLMNSYRENIEFESESGELTIDGKSMQPFSKEYWLPSKEGEEPQIETIGNDGPDLSDTESLRYFQNKLKLMSKIPFSRFEMENQPIFESGSDGQQRDEINFSRFINRLRSQFQEIIIKPLWIQMTLNFPDLKEDEAFKAAISIQYHKYNEFEKNKELDRLEKQLSAVDGFKRILADDNTEFFPTEWLLLKYTDLTQDEINDIKAMKSETDAENIENEDGKDEFEF
jgi:hypothetical protein